MLLRRIREEDLEELFNQRNHPEIYRWCRQNAPLHWDNHVAWYKRQSSSADMSMFSVMDNHEVVGVCGLTSIDMVNSRAEFSLYIGSKYQGQGFGKKALVELLRYGFNAIGLNRIWGESFEGNPAVKMFSKIGFEVEGVRDEFYYRNGRYIDATLFSIGRARFDALHPIEAEEPTGT